MRSRRARYGGLLAIALGGLALALAVLAAWQRAGLRAQTLRREAETLHAVTVWQHVLERERLGGLGLAEADQALAILALATSRLPHVVGAEAFGLDGRPAGGVGAALGIAAPSPEDWERLLRRGTMARFVTVDEERLEVTVPLHDPDASEVTGAVRYWLEATAVRREFQATDRRLAQQAILVWLAAGGTLALALGLVLRRLDRAEADLRTRTADLQAANRDLTFAAKTSAIGALAAHLVHGLRNPIAGLESLAQVEPAEAAESLREASAAARRMRELVNEVVALLRESPDTAARPVAAGDVLAEVAGAVAETARKHGVALAIEAEPSAPTVSPRAAGVTGSILRNLARNACEAAGEGGRVVLRAAAAGHGVEFVVEDDGPGLAPAVAARLFEPVPSTKPGGAGIGLAICRHLAMGLDAVLQAEPVPGRGTRFRLRLPIAA